MGFCRYHSGEGSGGERLRLIVAREHSNDRGRRDATYPPDLSGGEIKTVPPGDRFDQTPHGIVFKATTLVQIRYKRCTAIPGRGCIFSTNAPRPVVVQEMRLPSQPDTGWFGASYMPPKLGREKMLPYCCVSLIRLSVVCAKVTRHPVGRVQFQS